MKIWSPYKIYNESLRLKFLVFFLVSCSVALLTPSRALTQKSSKDAKELKESKELKPSVGIKDTKVITKTPNVLDFEADVIEGERSSPSILIQMDLQSPNIDTLVFQRKNFNDFHQIDMKRRSKYRGSN